MNAPVRLPSATQLLGAQLAEAVRWLRVYEDDLRDLMLRLHARDLWRHGEQPIDAKILREARRRRDDAGAKVEAIESRILDAVSQLDMRDTDDLGTALLDKLHEITAPTNEEPPRLLATQVVDCGRRM